MANTSPETITMLTVPHTFQRKRHILPADVVVTMDSPRLLYQVQQRYPHLMYGDRPERVWKLTLPFDAALCLNVIGGTGPVAITNILQTLDTFEADHIYEFRYGTAAAAFDQ